MTRLWTRNLPTISVATAEEIAQSSVNGGGATQANGGMSSSDSTLWNLLDLEHSRKRRRGKETESTGEPAGLKKRFQSGLVGYEVNEEELASLAVDIDNESARYSLLYILDMLTAIFASEKSEALLSKLFSMWGDILDNLFRQKKWTIIEHILRLPHASDSIRPDLSDEHKQQVILLLHEIGRADRVHAIETFLNQSPGAHTEGLAAVLLAMTPDTVPILSSLLENLTTPAHQAVASDALVVLTKDHSHLLMKGQLDRRPTYVRNLLAILMQWNDPKFAEPVEKLVRYPDTQGRKDVVRAIRLFCPSGNGVTLISFMADGESSVRIAALQLLVSGQYRTPFSSWSQTLSEDAFMDRPMSERRAIFQAVRATCGDEELALLAADALGKLATPADAQGNPVNNGPELDLTEKGDTGEYRHSIIRVIDNATHKFDTSRYFV